MSADDLRDRDAGRGLGWQLRWALVILGCLAVVGGGAMLLTRSVVRAYVVASGSMMPALLPGDHLFFDMTAYGLRVPLAGVRLRSSSVPAPRRGDVAVLVWGEDDNTFVNRIVGLPGELIEIRDKQVYIDGAALDEPYAAYSDPQVNPSGQRDTLAPVQIPAGHVFVMGDNRDRSYDSRFRGFLPVDALRGRASRIYFSWDDKQTRVRWERIGTAPAAP